MFQQFREALKDQYCFGIQQIDLMFPGFSRKNLSHWQERGYIIKLRNGLYTFGDYKNEAGIELHFAGNIYQPSYISLHSALHYYGLIPEFPGSITSISTRKTKAFNNDFGQYSYQTVQPARFFGYQYIDTGKWSVKIAGPEKAIVDLLYLYPMYNNEEELELLRLDDDNLGRSISVKMLQIYASQMQSKALQERVDVLISVYGL